MEGQTSVNDHYVLSELALQCQQSFKNISHLLQGDEAIVTRIRAILAQPGGSKPRLTLRDLEDDHEQFRVWTKNLGVFATDQASLDFRLREANDARVGIASLLVSLKSELIASHTLLRQDGVYEEEKEKEDDDISSDRMPDSGSSSESDDEVYSPIQLAALELQARLRRISDIIDKLMRLAEVIRASGVGHRNIRAAQYVHHEDGVNMTAQFEEQYLPLVLRHKFKLESPLLERFKKAISMRRRRFMYQDKHQKRLAYGGNQEEQVGSTKQLPRMNSATFVSVHEGFVPVHKAAAPKIISTVPNPNTHSDLQAPTQATRLEGFPLKQKMQSTIVSASNKSAVSGVEFPLAPPISERATHFQCPYCCLLVPRRKLVGRYWREHVIADLQPFICVEPECQTPDQTFESQQDWVEHQKWEHSLVWWCEGDETQHAPMRFSSSEAYVAHLKQSRGLCGSRKSMQNIDTHVETAGRPSLTPFSCCPLCDFLPDSVLSLTLETAQDGVNMAAVSQSQLQKHIADEMLAIFMLALPDRSDIDHSLTEIESNRPVDTRSTILALSNVSLNFVPLEDGSMDANDEKPTTIGSFGYDTLSSLGTEAPESSEEWAEIWTSPRLQQSVRKSYAGVGEDEVLQNFVQSMQTPETTHKPTRDRVEREILNALRFRDMDIRQQVIAEAHPKTFRWIFEWPVLEHPWSNFKEWLENGEGIYWINGKVGSGKSTLMKYIAGHEQLSMSLLKWARSQGEQNSLIIASFFIYRHGSPLQNTQEGLLRALLYQILDQRRDLIPVAFPTLCHTFADSHMFDGVQQLTLDELRIGLSMLSKSLPANTYIFLMIDGLDEYNGDPLDLIELVEDATENPSVKALVSSRPIPTCLDAYSVNPQLRLQDLTESDILEYVQASLSLSRFVRYVEAVEPGAQYDIANIVLQKAAGVFLWVVVVVRSLFRGLAEHEKKSELLERIDRLPGELEALYDCMMYEVSPEQQEEASLMLQLVHRSTSIQDKYPMTVLQLSFAIEDPSEGSSTSIEQITPEEESARHDITHRRIESQCCGLIECQEILVRSDCCDMTTKEVRIAFLHRSVIDFFNISEEWSRVRAVKPYAIYELDERLLVGAVRELQTTGFDQRTRCRHESTYLIRHRAPSLRPLFTAIHGLKYSRSMHEYNRPVYVDHLIQLEILVQSAPRGLYPTLETIVNHSLPAEGFDLLDCLDYPYGFLLYAAASGLSDFVRAYISSRNFFTRTVEGAELSRLLLYLLINLHNQSPLIIGFDEDCTRQRNQLSDSVIALLQSGINPNIAGLFWNDIETATVSEDIRKAVRVSPNQQNDLVPWIYWLVCNDQENDLLANDRALYYRILDEMLDAGANLYGFLGGQPKQERWVYDLVLKNISGLAMTDGKLRALHDSIVHRLDKVDKKLLSKWKQEGYR